MLPTLRPTAAFLLMTATLAAAPASRAATPASDADRLGTLLKARGFVPPEHFKALVVLLGDGRAEGYKPAAFDYANTSDDRDDWWPASTVKLFAAVAALETTRRLGFPPRVKAHFHYEERERALRVDFLVRQALVPSNNLCFDLLVELVGAATLNDRFFTADNGLAATKMQRAYFGRVRDEATEHPTNRHSPPITLSWRDRSKDLPERDTPPRWDCPDIGNCTTLRDLAEAMRRVMLHEELPPTERFDLGEAELKVLRKALAARRKRGNGVVDGLRKGFGRELRTWHKPGFAHDWMSDVVYAVDPKTKQRFIVAMAGFPGREALDAAARHVGALLRSGALGSP